MRHLQVKSFSVLFILNTQSTDREKTEEHNWLVIRWDLVAVEHNTNAEQEGTQTLNYQL